MFMFMTLSYMIYVYARFDSHVYHRLSSVIIMKNVGLEIVW